MKKIFPTKSAGLTLTELIVATAVLGIAMLGVFAVDYAIRSTRANSATSSQLSMQAAAVLMEITNALNHMTGKRWDGSAGNQTNQEGFFGGNSTCFGHNCVTVCARYDADNDPNTFTGDRWKCFQQDELSKILYRCDLADLTALPCAQNNTNYLVTLPSSGFYSTYRDADGRLEHVKIIIGVGSALGGNPLTNPNYAIDADVYPPALSQ